MKIYQSVVTVNSNNDADSVRKAIENAGFYIFSLTGVQSLDNGQVKCYGCFIPQR